MTSEAGDIRLALVWGRNGDAVPLTISGKREREENM